VEIAQRAQDALARFGATLGRYFPNIAWIRRRHDDTFPAMNARWRLNSTSPIKLPAVLVPLVLTLHLVFAHGNNAARHLEVAEPHAGFPGQVRHFVVGSRDVSGNLDLCPVPSISLRPGQFENLAVSVAPLSCSDVPLMLKSHSGVLVRTAPKRLPGPDRQALLQRFLL
jgi:hypothetical protein